MVAEIIDKSVMFMLQRGAIPDTEEQIEIYKYGIELQIHYFINATLLIIIGLLFGHGWEVVLLLITFGAVQVNAGGFHADTRKGCLSIMVFGTLVFFLLLQVYEVSFFLQFISVSAGLITVLKLAPVSHKNHPISPQTSNKLGKRAKYIAVALTMGWCALSYFGANAAGPSIISAAMVFSCVSLVCAKLKKTREMRELFFRSERI